MPAAADSVIAQAATPPAEWRFTLRLDDVWYVGDRREGRDTIVSGGRRLSHRLR